MRFVLTGGTGFLGKGLIDLLVGRGNELCILIRPDSNTSSIEHYDSVTLIEYDSLKNEKLITQLESWNPEVMIHLGWKGVQGGERNSAYHFTYNIANTLDSVHVAKQAGCRKWIGIGSQAEYGIPNRKVTETSNCFPVTAYGKAKLAAGIAALGLCDLLGMEGTWGRVFSVYGPGDHENSFISYLIDCFLKGKSPALTNCEQQWDYLYISDAAAAIAALAQSSCKGIYNIGSGETVQLKEVVEMIKRQVCFDKVVDYGSKPYANLQIMHLQADISKINQHTSWRPQVALKNGLINTIASFQLINK